MGGGRDTPDFDVFKAEKSAFELEFLCFRLKREGYCDTPPTYVGEGPSVGFCNKSGGKHFSGGKIIPHPSVWGC